MKTPFIGMLRGILLGCMLIPAGALACNPEQDGCLGCNDEELPVCLNIFVQEVCASFTNPGNCDAPRIYDDVERHVLISTGSHMSHIRSMLRNPRKYKRR